MNPKNSGPLDENTLMKDRRISLDSWLGNPTSQGLPRKDTKKGDLYFWYSRRGNNSVARFYAYSYGANLFCDRSPSGKDSDLGVRSIKRE